MLNSTEHHGAHATVTDGQCVGPRSSGRRVPKVWKRACDCCHGCQLHAARTDRNGHYARVQVGIHDRIKCCELRVITLADPPRSGEIKGACITRKCWFQCGCSNPTAGTTDVSDTDGNAIDAGAQQ